MTYFVIYRRVFEWTSFEYWPIISTQIAALRFQGTDNSGCIYKVYWGNNYQNRSFIRNDTKDQNKTRFWFCSEDKRLEWILDKRWLGSASMPFRVSLNLLCERTPLYLTYRWINLRGHTITLQDFQNKVVTMNCCIKVR